MMLTDYTVNIIKNKYGGMRMLRKVLSVILTVLMCVMVLSACGGSQTSAPKTPSDAGTEPTSAEDEPSDEPKEAASVNANVIYFIGKENQYTHWLAVKKGAEEAGKEFGYEVRYLAPPNGETDLETQANMVLTAISDETAAVCLAPNDAEALAGPCGQVKAAGIPMILYDSAITTDDYDLMVSLDHVKCSEGLSKVLVDQIGGKGQIAIINAVPGASTLEIRENALKDYVAQNCPDVEIVGETLYSSNDPTKAMNATYDFLTAYPDVAAFYTTNSPTAEGIASALKERNLGGERMLACYDVTDAILQGLEDGFITAVSVVDSYGMGYDTVKYAVQFIKGESIPGIVDKFVSLDATYVTPENFKEPAIQKLLHPLD